MSGGCRILRQAMIGLNRFSDEPSDISRFESSTGQYDDGILPRRNVDALASAVALLAEEDVQAPLRVTSPSVFASKCLPLLHIFTLMQVPSAPSLIV